MADSSPPVGARALLRPALTRASAPPRQLQVNIGLRVLTRPNPERLPEIYRNLGEDYAERVLPSIIQVRLYPS